KQNTMMNTTPYVEKPATRSPSLVEVELDDEHTVHTIEDVESQQEVDEVSVVATQKPTKSSRSKCKMVFVALFIATVGVTVGCGVAYAFGWNPTAVQAFQGRRTLAKDDTFSIQPVGGGDKDDIVIIQPVGGGDGGAKDDTVTTQDEKELPCLPKLEDFPTNRSHQFECLVGKTQQWAEMFLNGSYRDDIAIFVMYEGDMMSTVFDPTRVIITLGKDGKTTD
ncbi:MAG: hypothetical protein SGILL_010836, partial [Bacillariaceae sp.]